MGLVDRARHTRIIRDVALKIGDRGRPTDGKLSARLRREINVCSQLQHDLIVPTDDVVNTTEQWFLCSKTSKVCRWPIW